MKKVLITMQMDIKDEVFEELARAVDHNIESLVNTTDWPEIERIYGCKLDDLTERTMVENNNE